MFYIGRMWRTFRTFRRESGFTLIEVFTIVVILCLALIFLLSGMIRAKRQRLTNQCVNNLKQVGLAFRLWSPDSSDEYQMARSTNGSGTKEYINTGDVFRHFQVMSNELGSPSVIVCPTDKRLAAKDFISLSNSNLSYFVGVDASETAMPPSMLTGDRNLVVNGSAVKPGLLVLKSNDVVSWGSKMHNGQGSVAMTDGSVQNALSAGLVGINAKSGTNLNRLEIP